MTKIASLKCFAMALGILAAGAAQAQVFKITPGTNSSGLSDQQFADLLSQLEAQINAELPSVETGQYTKGMANATAMASTGTTSVYGSSFKYGLIGGSVALGVDLGKDNKISSFDAKKVAGFGVQSAAVLGFTPGSVTSAQWGPIDPARLRVFLSFLSLEQNPDNANVKFTSMGFVGQYRLVQEKSLGLNAVKWNGVDVSSGFRIAKSKFDFTQTLPAFSQTSGAVTATVNAAPATLGADVNVYSIPVEISTSARLLYVLNFFGGLGGDFNFGTSKAIANYTAPINMNVGGNGQATGALQLGGDTSPTPWNLRAFAGLGIEFGIGQLNLGVGKSLTAGAYALNVGLNLFY